ncbi:MAG: right-handed parallel beta-helix repeat-containing protein [Bacteroidetes bacterium]|nr:right-handed parallel beta-helix repeat-containing protein [Bacteroidota bacterium]
MRKLQLLLLIVIGFFSLTTHLQSQEYVVNSTEDLPDSDLSDNIYSPQTLRSALQNIERYGGNQIRFLMDRMTYRLTQGFQLPSINRPIKIIGKGSTIHGEDNVQFGLVVNPGASGSEIEDLRLTGFRIIALNIQCNNSTFRSIEIHDNLGAGIVLNGASNNRFVTDSSVYSRFNIYNNKGDFGYGMQIDEDSDNNVLDRLYFGCKSTDFVKDYGNQKDGLFIRGQGTTVRNCVFAYNRKSGIEIDQPTLNALPTTIYDCDFQTDRNDYPKVGTQVYSDTSNQKTGVNLFRCSNVTIKRCVFARHRSYGIGSGVRMSNIVIDSNIFGIMPIGRASLYEFDFNNIEEQLGESAIRVAGNNIVVSNNFIGLAGNGIGIFKGNTITVIGNTIGITKGDSVVSVLKDGIFIGDLVDSLTIGDKLNPLLGNTIVGCKRHCLWAQSYDATKDMIIANNNIGVKNVLLSAIPCQESGLFLEGNITMVSIVKNNISSLVNGVKIQTLFSTLEPKTAYTPSDISIVFNSIGFVLPDTSKLNNSNAGINLNGVKNLNLNLNNIRRSQRGILCESTLNSNVVISNNIIGGVSPIDTVTANAEDAITLAKGCSGISVGTLMDSLSGNLIYNNGGAAIAIYDSSIKNLIVYNIMIGNKKGSIALGDGALYYSAQSDRDTEDLDDGPNSLQNAPYMKSIIPSTDIVNYTAELVGKPGSKHRIDEYLTLKLPQSLFYFMPAIQHIGNYEVTIPSSGTVEISGLIKIPEVIRLIKERKHTIALTATNQELETSQLGSIIFTPVLDLSVQYDSSASVVSEHKIKTQLIIKNKSLINAVNVETTDKFPVSFTVDSANATKGEVAIKNDYIQLTIPELNALDSVILTVYGKEQVTGIHKRYAEVITTGSIDVVDSNNQDSLFLLVNTTSVHNNELQPSAQYFSEGRTIMVRPTKSFKSIQLIDIAGRIVAHQDYSYTEIVQFENIPAGVYVVSVLNELNAKQADIIVHY